MHNPRAIVPPGTENEPQRVYQHAKRGARERTTNGTSDETRFGSDATMYRRKRATGPIASNTRHSFGNGAVHRQTKP